LVKAWKQRKGGIRSLRSSNILKVINDL
jgi:hypothetical protein